MISDSVFRFLESLGWYSNGTGAQSYLLSQLISTALMAFDEFKELLFGSTLGVLSVFRLAHTGTFSFRAGVSNGRLSF